LKKYRVPGFAHSPVRVIDKFPHDERFFSPYGNSPTEYKQFVINQLTHGEISRYKAEKRVAHLGNVSPKKEIFGFVKDS
jgi:hypothetical protein